MKTLVMFDFDDTLFESNSQIVVRSPRSGTKYLSSGEYASFVPEHDDELDFSQFEGYPPDIRPIKATVQRLEAAVAKFGLDNVIILTARAKSQPIIQVLTDFSLPSIFVAAVGSSNPVTKADYIVRTVEEEDYKRVIIYEDNVKNIVAIKSAIEPVLGKNNVIAFNVKQQGDGHSLVRY